MLTPITSFVSKHLKIHQKKIHSLRFAIVGSILVLLAYVIVVIDPIANIVKDQLSIREGSLLFGLFKKPPLDVYISVYVFNITNLSAFLSKEDPKLKLQEVGPYVYQEILEHHNYTFNDNGTLTYFPKRKVIFVPEKSIGDPKIDTVIVPNIPLLGASSAAASYSVFAALALSGLTKSLQSEPVLNLTIDEYLWGYDDPLVKLASTVIPNVITFDSFGLLDRMFDEGENEVMINLPERKLIEQERLRKELEEKEKAEMDMPVSASLKGSADYNVDYDNDNDYNNNVEQQVKVGKKEIIVQSEASLTRDYSIHSWNQDTGFSYWGYDNTNYNNSKNTVCNRLRGAYDGTLFPKNISKEDEYRIYRKAFCRTLPIKFEREATLYGLQGYYFKLTDNAFDSEIDDPNSNCFCQQKKCLKKGLGNITPCYYNIPTAVSYPHFYNSDPSLLDGVEGLKPDPEKHGSEIVLQPQLGVPMRVHSRIQLNLLMDKTKFNARLKPFEDTVIPIVWMEISCEGLTYGLIFMLHFLFHVLPYIQSILLYILCITGASLYALAALLFFCMPKSNQHHAKKDIRYSAMYWFPQIRLNETDKVPEEERKMIEIV